MHTKTGLTNGTTGTTYEDNEGITKQVLISKMPKHENSPGITASRIEAHFTKTGASGPNPLRTCGASGGGFIQQHSHSHRGVNKSPFDSRSIYFRPIYFRMHIVHRRASPTPLTLPYAATAAVRLPPPDINRVTFVVGSPVERQR